MNKTTYGVSITTIIAIVLSILKIFGLINISWIWIITIWLFPIVITISIFIIMIIAAIFLGLFKQSKYKN